MSTDNLLQRKLSQVLHRELVASLCHGPRQLDYRSLYLVRAQAGKMSTGALPSGAGLLTGIPDLSESLESLGAMFSTPKGRMLLHANLDETFCGAVVLFGSGQPDADEAAEHLGRSGGLFAFGAMTLGDVEGAMVFDYDRSGVEDVTGRTLGTAFGGQVMGALWSLVTSIDDALAAPLPANATSLALGVMLEGAHRGPAPTDTLPGGRKVIDGLLSAMSANQVEGLERLRAPSALATADSLAALDLENHS